MPQRTWQPILGGDLGERAWQAVREIADDLAELDHGARDVEQALFWAYAASAFDDALSHQRLERAADRLASRLETEFAGLALYGGLLGAGWVAHHLSGDDENQELFEQIDGELDRALTIDTWVTDYDLISGLVGYGVYLVERLRGPRPERAIGALQRVVDHLIALAERDGEHSRWLTPPAMLPPSQREMTPDGYYNLGLAHGIPGVVALLGLIQASPARSPRAGDLLERAVSWLRSQKLSTTEQSCYPGWISPHEPASPTRTAWCYGDPGVTAALWGAARRVGGTWEADAIAVARVCAEREASLCGVVDASLCHGAAGLGHVFNRFYQASQDSLFRDASIRWFTAALDMRRPGGVGGVFACRFNDGKPRLEPEVSFLEGAIGVGLALLAALGVDPAWDRLLLCDVPLE